MGVTDVEAYRNIVKEDVDLSFMKENEAEKYPESLWKISGLN